MRILFKADSTPYNNVEIQKFILKFGTSYKNNVRFIIENSQGGISESVFEENVSKLLSNFKMTRRGPFEGVKFVGGKLNDPDGKVATCWRTVGTDLIKIRTRMERLTIGTRARFVTNINHSDLQIIVAEIWIAFKKLLPICMGDHSLGMVAASKILFALLPEIALPVDNKQWRTVFQTIDYGDILLSMVNEIKTWENQTDLKLNMCDPYSDSTLPSVYNVMAMHARDEKKS
jgi:hypothetical protein